MAKDDGFPAGRHESRAACLAAPALQLNPRPLQGLDNTREAAGEGGDQRAVAQRGWREWSLSDCCYTIMFRPVFADPLFRLAKK
jgi:hypothetical protein